MMRPMRAALIALLMALPLLCAAQEADLPSVRLNVSHATGKAVEDLTGQSVARYYASAWRTLETAYDGNRAGIIDNDFVGVAAKKLTSAVELQSKSGLHQRFVDRGHQVNVVFYSPDGTSIELRDTAQIEVQYMDGDRVLHSENGTRTYVAVLTPTEVRWKVRVLQQVQP